MTTGPDDDPLPMGWPLKVGLILGGGVALVILVDWSIDKYLSKLAREIQRDCAFYRREIAEGTFALQPEPERQWRETYMRQNCDGN